MKETAISIFWIRRDLRWEDNTGLYHALSDKYPVLPVFIFDTLILEDLEIKKDARVEFIVERLGGMSGQLKSKNSGIHFCHGKPLEEWRKILQEFNVRKVFTNHDYEPYARERDEKIELLLQSVDIPFYSFKDQVIFEKDEVIKGNGDPYVVFTPYSQKWKSKPESKHFESFTSGLQFENFANYKKSTLPSLHSLGFKSSDIKIPPINVSDSLMAHYATSRDYPAQKGTSRIGLHLRFGTISIRQLVARAHSKSDAFLNELIWREFYMMILWHFPRVVTENFHSKYDKLKWDNNIDKFNKWCEGRTGYPIVDAGMRQLNSTGYMHNRVRMIVASFLTKDLLIDWRWGEAYFASRLLDYELASNNGGWQWAAGTGTDAQPYFRIFNPASQAKKFDPDQKYIRQWVPEFGTEEYPDPIVDHSEARKKALSIYKQAIE